MIDGRRWAIVGDILAELRRPAAALARYSRWSRWEEAVLSRVADPAGCQAAIAERQGAIDDDQAEADLVRGAFVAEMRRRGHTPETDAVWMPAAVAAAVVNAATGERFAVNRASNYLGNLVIPERGKATRATAADGPGRPTVRRGGDAGGNPSNARRDPGPSLVGLTLVTLVTVVFLLSLLSKKKRKTRGVYEGSTKENHRH